MTAVLVWLVRRKGEVQRGDTVKRETPGVSTPAAPELPAPRSENEQPTGQFDPTALAHLAAAMHDQNLREFLGDITKLVEEAGPVFDSETSLGFVEELVDRWDDLGTVREKQPEALAKDIDAFRSILEELLSRCEVELLRSESWDPSTQRAISKEPRPGIKAPRILRVGSTGIRYQGKLIRKQEVVLAIPETP